MAIRPYPRISLPTALTRLRVCEHPMPTNITNLGCPATHYLCEACGADWTSTERRGR